jgi:hypothetical protein
MNYEILRLNKQDEYSLFLTFAEKNDAYNKLFELYKQEYYSKNDYRLHDSICKTFGIRSTIYINDEILQGEIKHFTFDEVKNHSNWDDRYTKGYDKYKKTCYPKPVESDSKYLEVESDPEIGYEFCHSCEDNKDNVPRTITLKQALKNLPVNHNLQEQELKCSFKKN